MDRGEPPVALSPFVGRRREAGVVLRLLRDPDVRLLTILGPGGVGKTRLTQHALARLRDVTSGAAPVVWVSLASVTDPADVAGTIARTVGAPVESALAPAESIRMALQGQPAILVLDTFEHLLDARSVVTDLLSAYPNLRVVVTSRVPLHLSGEQLYRLQPMAVPGPESKTGERIGKTDAVRFFVARASTFDPEFTLTLENELVVAEICRRLDGLPLAIELAAARVGLFTPVELLRRLDRRLPLLVGGPQDTPERHRTLRAAISWSYDLLEPVEQRLFRWLSLFADGFTLEFAEQIVADWADAPALDLVATLVDASLVQRQEAQSPPRYALLDTIREYGLEQLVDAGELMAAGAAHAETMRRFALQLEPQLQPSANLLATLQAVDGALEDLRAALRWFEEHDPDRGGQLFSALAQYWLRRSMWRESRDWSEHLLARLELSRVERMRLQVDLARAMNYQFDFSQPELSADAYALACELDDVVTQLDALLVQITTGILRSDSGIVQERIGIARQTLERAPEPMRTSRALTIDLFDAMVQARLGNPVEGERLTEQYLARATASGDSMRAALLYWSRSALENRRGDTRAARYSLRLAFERFTAAREFWSMGGVVGDLAMTVADDQPLMFARLMGFCSRLYGLCGLTPPVAVRPEYASVRAAVVATIGDELWRADQQLGAQMAIDDGVRYVMEITADAIDPREPQVTESILSPDRSTASGRLLSPRQQEVLRLIASGRSDREIALTLGISYRTTTTYVTAILARLNVPSRAAAAAWAARNGLAATDAVSAVDMYTAPGSLP